MFDRTYYRALSPHELRERARMALAVPGQDNIAEILHAYVDGGFPVWSPSYLNLASVIPYQRALADAGEEIEELRRTVRERDERIRQLTGSDPNTRSIASSIEGDE